MTLTCDVCDGRVELVNDNGAEFPETRVEFYECADCGHEQRTVLSAEPHR